MVQLSSFILISLHVLKSGSFRSLFIQKYQFYFFHLEEMSQEISVARFDVGTVIKSSVYYHYYECCWTTDYLLFQATQIYFILIDMLFLCHNFPFFPVRYFRNKLFLLQNPYAESTLF